ncbi:MAG: PAS domain-containing protein [Magnetospirillum sp.]|nr:PAS domain-containing protein [Magnetospirillum sp.]
MRTLNHYLITLILAIALPGLVFGAAASWWLAKELRSRLEGEAARVAEASAEDVADKVRMTIAAMRVLARSPSIANGDFAAAYRAAEILADDIGQDIGLATPDGSQIFNTRRPFGEPLPRRSNSRSYMRALATARPSVSDVIIGAIAQTALITIDLPVSTTAGPLVLATSTEGREIAAVLTRSNLALGWVIAVVDGDGRTIARSAQHAEFTGRMEHPEVAAAQSDQMAGRSATRTFDGVEIATFFHKVRGTGWTVVVCVPKAILRQPLRQQYAWLAGGGAVALLLTSIVAVILGRHLRTASTRLTEVAAAVGQGREAPTEAMALAEFEAVAEALRNSRGEILEREERLRLFTEIVPAAIAMLDTDMRYIAVSRRFAEDLRVPLDGLIGRSHYDVFPEIPQHWKEIHRRCLNGAIERCPQDAFPRADGTTDWLSWEIRPWQDSDGKVGGIAMAIEIISERKRTGDELRAAKAEAERASAAKSRFLAAASHDLRQPVQSLMLLLEVLRGRAGDGPLAKLTDAMEKALEALGTLLNGILDISKLEAGIVVPSFEAVSLGVALERLATEYAARGAERGIEVKLVPATAVIRTDPTLLERVLRNLMENALRYTEAGRILIGLRRRGGMVRIDVVDTGIGIAAEHLTAIFDEFHQLGNPARDRSQGLGLGLAIVERTVRLLGGRIEVASSPGKGSRFSVLLPRACRCSLPASDCGNDDPNGRGQAVLVVEDDPQLLAAMLLMLTEKGYFPMGAQSGEAAVALVENGCCPVAVVADHRMAGMLDGIGTIRAVRAMLGFNVAGLVVTGDTAPERIHEVHGAGIALLHKPVGSRALLQALSAALEEARAGPDEPGIR